MTSVQDSGQLFLQGSSLPTRDQVGQIPCKVRGPQRSALRPTLESVRILSNPLAQPLVAEEEFCWLDRGMRPRTLSAPTSIHLLWSPKGKSGTFN
jgi:hypothetical protein